MQDHDNLLYVLDLSRDFASNCGRNPFFMFLSSLYSFAKYADRGLHVAIVLRAWKEWHYETAKRIVRDFSDRVKLSFYDENSDLVHKVYDMVTERGFSEVNWWTGFQRMKVFPDVFFPGEREAVYADIDVFCNGAPISSLAHVDSWETRNGRRPIISGQWDPWDINKKYEHKEEWAEIGPHLNAGFWVADLEACRLASDARADIFRRFNERTLFPGDPDLYSYGDQSIFNIWCIGSGYYRHHMSIKDNFIRTGEWLSLEKYYEEYKKYFPEDLCGTNSEPEFRKLCFSSKTIHFTQNKLKLMEDDFIFKDQYLPYYDEALKTVWAHSAFGSVNRAVGAKKTKVAARKLEPAKKPSDRLTIFMASVGDRYFYDYVLPSLTAAMARSTCPFNVVMATDHDDESESSMIKRLSSYFGRDDRVSVLNAEKAFDFGCFGNSQWGGHSTKYVQIMSVLLPDVDDYVLFMDSDVLVLDDLKKMIALADEVGTKDALIARTATPWGLIYNDQPPSVMVSGGFYMVNPSGNLAKSVAKAIFSDPWHENDDCAFPAQATAFDDVYDISGMLACTFDNGDNVWKAVLARGGCRDPIAAHLVTTNMQMGRFNRRATKPGFGRYQSDFLMFRKFANTILEVQP